MPFQPVPDTARFAVVAQSGVGDAVVNVLYFARPALWGLPELQAATQALATAWVNDVMPFLCSECSLRRVQARGERDASDVSYELVLETPVNGGRTGQALPFQCAFCVTHLSGLTGRSNRGRTYFGYLAEVDNNNGLLDVAIANALRAGLVSVQTAMAAVGWTHVIVSRFANNTQRPVAVTQPVIGYKYTDLIVDTQRRRRLNLGS